MTYDPNYNNGQPNYQNQPDYNQQSGPGYSQQRPEYNHQGITPDAKTWRYSRTSHRFSPCCCR